MIIKPVKDKTIDKNIMMKSIYERNLYKEAAKKSIKSKRNETTLPAKQANSDKDQENKLPVIK